MPATVSIVVPVYNVGSYVDYCVRSVLSQTFPDWEMVLVNDGSSDDSGERCRRWAEVDARISLVNQENAGVSVARNNGLASSTGPYVMFVDPDDWLEPDSLETLLSGMGDGVEICVGDCLLEKHGQTKLIPMINCDQRDFDSNDRQRLMALATAGASSPLTTLSSGRLGASCTFGPSSTKTGCVSSPGSRRSRTFSSTSTPSPA